MSDASKTSRDGADWPRAGAGMTPFALKDWFQREVLPLEAILVTYLRQNWRDQSNIEDLLHDVYLQVYRGARERLPENPRAFVFTTARNLLISRVRRHNIVPIETVADLDALGVAIDTPDQERSTIARDELRRLQTAMDRLPPKYRDVVVMRRLDDLSRAEIAVRLGLSEETVTTYLRRGMCALADMLYAGQSPVTEGEP
jgi:RNA polymerase sigma-70 factor (ECF subfamily)